MDINNNAIGVQIGIDNPNADITMLISLIKNELDNANLVIIDNNMIRSDGRPININELKRYKDAKISKKEIMNSNDKKFFIR